VGGKSSIRPDFETASEILRAFVSADSDSEARAVLETLFRDHIGPWCQETARATLRNYGLRGTDQTDEQGEITSEVMLRMTLRLQEIRREGLPPIANLRAYVVSAVYNAFFARIRTRCPRHAQLQNRIRYLLGSNTSLACWTSDNGDQLAGLSAWQGRQQHVAAPSLQRSGEPLLVLVQNLFEHAGGPLRLADLVGAAADTLGISEYSAASEGNTEVPSPDPSSDRILVGREALARLWTEVLQLPASQRLALLLNLRDAGGNGVIELIPATGIATFPQLAESLEMPVSALAACWNDLPLEDAAIARMMGISRQQVINLRKSARDRLARRQKKADGNTGPGFASPESAGMRLRSKLQGFLRGGENG